MDKIVKRLLNVVTLLCTCYLLILIVMIVTGNVYNWVDFISCNFFPLAIAYVAIAATNYIAFRKITRWHGKVAPSDG